MKYRKNIKVAALMLAIVMLLGLTACGGHGSHVLHSDLVGKWASEVMTLWFKADIPNHVLVSFDNSDMYYGYSYTIEGNVLEVELESVQSALELTVDSGRLVSEDMVFTKLPDDSDNTED